VHILVDLFYQSLGIWEASFISQVRQEIQVDLLTIDILTEIEEMCLNARQGRLVLERRTDAHIRHCTPHTPIHLRLAYIHTWPGDGSLGPNREVGGGNTKQFPTPISFHDLTHNLIRSTKK
jgi:hypothetical protein